MNEGSDSSDDEATTTTEVYDVVGEPADAQQKALNAELAHAIDQLHLKNAELQTAMDAAGVRFQIDAAALQAEGVKLMHEIGTLQVDLDCHRKRVIELENAHESNRQESLTLQQRHEELGRELQQREAQVARLESELTLANSERAALVAGLSQSTSDNAKLMERHTAMTRPTIVARGFGQMGRSSLAVTAIYPRPEDLYAGTITNNPPLFTLQKYDDRLFQLTPIGTGTIDGLYDFFAARNYLIVGRPAIATQQSS